MDVIEIFFISIKLDARDVSAADLNLVPKNIDAGHAMVRAQLSLKLDLRSYTSYAKIAREQAEKSK